MPAIDACKIIADWHRRDFACMLLMHEATHVTSHCFDFSRMQLTHRTTHLILHCCYCACTQQCLHICCSSQAHSCLLSHVFMQGAGKEKEIGKTFKRWILRACMRLEHLFPSQYCVCFPSPFRMCFQSFFCLCFRSQSCICFQPPFDCEFAVHR